ncbi:MAG: hypothetical protein ACYDC0_12345 [Acidimicrobiales bacterium]
MAEHLVSVRFDEETLEQLKTLAEINNSNVAEEVRTAVASYIAKLRSDGDFLRTLEEANERRERRIKQLLSGAAGVA